MSAGHHDPRTLYTIDRIKAYHIQNGTESSLTPSGSQTMSLLMVPTSSPFADLSSTMPQNEIPEEDFYLHLHLPPELDLPLPATTQIYHQPPRNYLIPRWDMGPESGAFTRIEFPEKVSQDDIDTFETILAQCTAFLERAHPPPPEYSHKPYNPADWAQGKRVGDGKADRGQVVLIDEDDGSVVGQLADGAAVVEDPKLAHGSKTPVEIEVAQDGSRIDVRPVSEDYLRMARHPAFKDSSLVQNAAAASRLIVTTTGYVGNMMSSGAENFAQKTTPNPQPMTFGPATHERVRKLHSVTAGTANLSAKTVGSVTKIAQNVGANMTRKQKKPEKGFDKEGKPVDTYRPGFLNKSMIAFSTVADGIAESGRTLLTQSGSAASSMVGHKYGQEAGDLAGQMAGGVKNVGLVYIDVAGVSRRAVIKSVAKGMVVGHVKDGGEVIVGGGDGGVIPEQDIARAAKSQSKNGAGGVRNEDMHAGEPHVVGFGTTGQAQPPPGYSSDLGERLGASSEKARPPQV